MGQIIGYADYPTLIPASSSVNMENLDPNFSMPLYSLASDFYNTYGRPLRVGDAWRSTDTQAKAYQDWIAGRKNVPVVAKPGTSRHEFGQAVDIAREDVPLVNQMPLQNYGLETGAGWRRSEPWHLQLQNLNQQLSAYYQSNRKQQGQQNAPQGVITGYAEEPQQQQQGGYLPTLSDLGQLWPGFKEGIKGLIPKYGALVSGGPESTYQEEYQKWKEAMGVPEPPPQTWWGQVARGVGGGAAMVPELIGLNAILPGLGTAGLAGRVAQGALPFAASSFLNPEAGLGDFAHSAILGGALGAVPPTWGRMLRVPATAGIGGGIGYAATGDPRQSSADAAALAIMSALHGAAPRPAEMPQVESRALVPGRIIQPWERTDMAPPGGPGGMGGQRLLPEGIDTIYPQYQEVPTQALPGITRALPQPQLRLPGGFGEQRGLMPITPEPKPVIPTQTDELIPVYRGVGPRG